MQQFTRVKTLPKALELGMSTLTETSLSFLHNDLRELNHSRELSDLRKLAEQTIIHTVTLCQKLIGN